MSFINMPLWDRGFRPFFMFGALYSVISIFIWGSVFTEYIAPPDLMTNSIWWHAHEMVYGFAVAIVSGFLLTAVANWTGGAPTKKWPLLGLCLLWLMGRVVINIDMGLPYSIICIIDVLFLPALAIVLSIPLLKSKNIRNFIFLGLLTILSVLNIAAFILKDVVPIYMALMIIITMISIIGGRVIPAFTVANLRQRGIKIFQIGQNHMDIAALISLLIIIVTLTTPLYNSIIFSISAFISAIIHLLRMRHYHTFKSFSDPMLWILHMGYFWVIIGLILLGFAGLDFLLFSIAFHVLTVGAIGSMTIGMMCRVTLGHTGNDIRANIPTVIMFALMQLTILIRVFGIWAFPEYHTELIIVSAYIWSLIFAIYIASYSKILLSREQ